MTAFNLSNKALCVVNGRGDSVGWDSSQGDVTPDEAIKVANEIIRQAEEIKAREPEEIVCEVVEGSEFLCVKLPDSENYARLGDAIGWIPKEGYRFAGFRYAGRDGLYAEPVYGRDKSKHVPNEYSYYSGKIDKCESVVFPTKAIYRRQA